MLCDVLGKGELVLCLSSVWEHSLQLQLLYAVLVVLDHLVLDALTAAVTRVCYCLDVDCQVLSLHGSVKGSTLLLWTFELQVQRPLGHLIVLFNIKDDVLVDLFVAGLAALLTGLSQMSVNFLEFELLLSWIP